MSTDPGQGEAGRGDAGRVLVVEDDDNLRETLADVLADEGFVANAVATGGAAIDSAREHPPDVVVLDIMLPDVDGYTVCKQLRDAGCTAGVLMLTARTLEDDVVRGFDSGADAYLAKPYRLRELLARIRALLRRGGASTAAAAASSSGTRIALGPWRLDREARRVADGDGNEVELTRTEFDLLAFFVDRPGKALSRDQILHDVWGADVVVDPRTVDNFVSSLKRKLGWKSGADYAIVAVRGVGYRFERRE